MDKKKQAEAANTEEILEENAEKTEAGAETAEEPEQPAETSELEKALAEKAAVTEQYRRMLAEYDNYRKRTQREKDSIYGDAMIATIGALLPVLDNLERAAAQPTADEAYKKGVEMTLKQMYECLAKLKVEEIPAEGAAFDPELHSAVMHIEDESLGENIVAEVFQKGFTLNGRVIRHAMVKVAN